MNTPTPPIDQLEVVVRDTNALATQDKARLELIAALQPIAQRINEHALFAANLTIINETEATLAAREREKIVADAEKAVELLRAYDNNLMERLFRTHRAWTGFEGKFTDPLNDAARTVKQKIIAFQQAEQERARKEQERLQAEADEKARKEREKQLKAADKLKTPELKAERIEAANQIVAPQISVAAPKPAVRMQTRWAVGQLDKKLFLQAAAKDPNLHGYVDVNTHSLARAKAANSTLEIPGVAFKQVTV